MAIGRVSGLMLKPNLERQGVDLAFETDLLYLDVNNQRVGVKTSSPTVDFDVDGDAKVTGTLTVLTELVSGNISLAGNTLSSIDPNGNIAITPDGTGKVLIGTTTDAGNYMLQVAGSIRATGDIIANGNIVLGNANTDSITVEADFTSNLIPDVDDTYTLGQDSKRWQATLSTVKSGTDQNLVLDPQGTGLVLVSGDMTVTGTLIAGNLELDTNTISSTNTDGNIILKPNGVGKVLIGTTTDAGDYMLQVEGNIRATGDIVANGNIVLGNADTDSISVGADFTSDLIPNADDTYKLGNDSKRWQATFSSIKSGTDQDLVLDPQGTGQVVIADETKINIGGGSTGYVLTTNGSGALTWSPVTGGGGLVNGNSIPLGAPTDSDLVSPGATNDWTTSTTVTDALDDLNEIMLNVARGTYVGNVNFTGNTLSGPSPLTVQFTATYTGTPTAYLWDFGDGTTSTTGPVVSKTFTNTAGGQFDVQVTVSNVNGSGAGSSDVKLRDNYITLYTPNPIASFTLNDSTLDDGASVQLTNTSQYADSYVIYWGDGTTSAVSSNGDLGGVGGGAISHTYTVTGSADTRYQPYIKAISSTAGVTPVESTSATQNVFVFKTHTPAYTYTTLTGNNQYTNDPDGFDVTFTNTTAAGLGAASTFSGNRYEWTWGDGTTTSVNAGSGSAGDRSVAITKRFSLTNPAVQQTFTVTLKVYNGHSTSPFSSTTQTVTVNPDPQAVFTGQMVTTSDRTGDSVRVGYLGTDLNGVNRAIATFTNTSLNTDEYKWTWGDTTDSGVLTSGLGTPGGGAITKEYLSTGNFTVSLLATGDYSESASDDTKTQTNYITINAVPAAPAGLSTKTLSLSTTSVGTSPYLAALATDNSGGNAPSAGTSVTRLVSGTVTTNTVADVYNAYTGTLEAEVNGSTNGSKAFTSGSDAGTYTGLVITQDRDANAAFPGTYPSNFYKVFSAYQSKSVSSVGVGYSDMRLTHTTTGNTNRVGFVKDDVTLTPTVDLASATLSEGTAGSYRYISGIPYYNTGSPAVSLAGAKIYDWIGQTYQNTSTPFQIEPGTNAESTTGNVIASQTKTYANLDGATSFLSSGVPKADTGKNSSSAYTIGSQSISVAPAGVAAVQNIKFRATNVNGAGGYATFSKNIQVYTATPSGFVEDSIPVSASLGATYTDVGKRIYISGASGATPAYNSATNYYTSGLFTGAIAVAGTDEAIVRWNQLKHFAVDLSSYLPVGPDLATGRSGTQYLRGAFRRTNVASFNVTITGKISGFYIAAPGTAVDDASSLNGWLNASLQYAGAGVPGADTAGGGNGSNGCALTGADKIPTGTVISGTTYRLTLGSENLSNATGNQLLFSIALAPGDYITSVSFS